MKPEKFKKICKKYFTDPAFTMEDISTIDDIPNVVSRSRTISIFFGGYGILRYYCDIEKPYLLLADKFRYNEDSGKILPCRNDGSFLFRTWHEYTKLYNVGHNQLIKIILKLTEKIKIAKVEYKKQLIEKDFENEG